MHIDTFREEFVNKYMDLRQSCLPAGMVNTRTKNEVVRASLDKALSLVFSPTNFSFFSLPVIGDSKEGFYMEMRNYSLSQIEQYYLESISQKAEFTTAFKSLMLAETKQLEVYAAIAMMLKNSDDPEAQAFASKVLDKITKWSGPLLGSLFINLRQLYQWVLLPLKRDIIENDEAENFMITHKIIITMEDSLEEVQTKLDQLYAKVQELVSEGANPQDFPHFSMTANLQSFLGGAVSEMEAAEV